MAGMKALPWIKIIAGLSAFVLVYLALSMFRFQVVNVQTADGERTGTMDRWTGRVALVPVAAPTPAPEELHELSDGFRMP